MVRPDRFQMPQHCELAFERLARANFERDVLVLPVCDA